MSEQQSSARVAAQRVQAIIEAAEATAHEIEEKARADAAAYVANAKDAIDGLIAQAATLQARMDEIAQALGEAKAAVDAMAAEAKALGGQTPPPAEEAPAEPAAAAPPEPEPQPAAEGGAATAPEGARLVALNMALSGTPREETARYLRENFELADEDTLLDEVYARVAG